LIVTFEPHSYNGESNGDNFFALTGPDAAGLYLLAFGIKYDELLRFNRYFYDSVNTLGSEQQQRSNSGTKPREYLQHCNP
ncbi:hypothetical protein T4B_4746, partial [Trichinella pseudospiralis]